MTKPNDTSAKSGVSYRILPKGAGNIFTGQYDEAATVFTTFAKGDVVEGVDEKIAADLEDRGWVEILG